MRYKLLIAGAGIAGLLLVLQGVGVLGAGLRTTRSSTPPVVLAAAVSTRPAQKAAVVDLANTVNPAQDRAVSTPLTYAAASQPAPAVVATALPTVPPEAVAAARRSQVLPTPTPMANGARPQLIDHRGGVVGCHVRNPLTPRGRQVCCKRGVYHPPCSALAVAGNRAGGGLGRVRECEIRIAHDRVLQRAGTMV